jgi:hypothetical protein
MRQADGLWHCIHCSTLPPSRSPKARDALRAPPAPAKRPRQPLRSLTTPTHELANTAKYDFRCLLPQPPLKPTNFSFHLIIAPTLPRLLCLLHLVNIRPIQQEKRSGIHTQNLTSSFELIFKGVSACGS